MIYWASTEALLNLITPISFSITYFWLLANECFWVSGLDSTSIQILATIDSMSAEDSLNGVAHTWFRCPFFWPSVNQCIFPGLDFISSIQFPTVIWSISSRLSQCCWLNWEVSPSILSKSFYFVNSACVYCLLRTRFTLIICLVKLQPLAQSHDIRQETFVSYHFVIIIDFDEAPDVPCWPSFSDTFFDLEIQ